MGWCSEFGVEIAACDHPMVAGASACHCPVCATTCDGRFPGCPDVWARGPVEVELKRPARVSRPGQAEGIASTLPTPQETPDGYLELLEALRGIDARLETLERLLLDRASDDGPSELARRLDELSPASGQEVPAALRAPGGLRQSRAGRAAG